MRIYVKCRSCGIKILINAQVEIRSELPYYFELQCINGHISNYYNYEVVAEPSVSAAPVGLILGGIIGGFVGGTIGAVSGAVLLGGAGVNADEREKKAVERFNRS